MFFYVYRVSSHIAVFLLPGHLSRLMKCSERQLTKATCHIYLLILLHITYMPKEVLPESCNFMNSVLRVLMVISIATDNE